MYREYMLKVSTILYRRRARKSNITEIMFRETYTRMYRTLSGLFMRHHIHMGLLLKNLIFEIHT